MVARLPRHSITILLVIGLGLAAAGCAPPARLRSAPRYDAGLVLVLPGIEGSSIWNRNAAVGLDQGGVGQAIEVFDWTVSIPGLALLNLADANRQRAQALKLADRILEYQREHATAPVTLVAHSAGCNVALLALEELPARPAVDCALLLAPAVSPEYDLTPALQRVRRGIYNFYSGEDWVMLGAGTTLFGTADRTFGESAGAVGFRRPVSVPPVTHELYAKKLRQIAWTPRIARYGADGGHVGWTTVAFARNYLSHVVLDEPVPDPPRTQSQPTAENHNSR